MSEKNLRIESDYWNDFYARWGTDVPSQFCVMMATELERSSCVVEFGCGNGRDALYLANLGHRVSALDLSSEAISHNQQRADQASHLSARFVCGDVTLTQDVEQILSTAREADESLTVYSRFFLHTLDQQQEASFLSALSQAMTSGDRLYLEFRSAEDATIDKLFTGHFRRYIQTDTLLDSIDETYQMQVVYHHTGLGMAKYKQEDPFVSRVIATRR